MANDKKQASKIAENPNNPPGVIRRAGGGSTTKNEVPSSPEGEAKESVDMRMLGWFGNNTWLLSLLNLAAAAALISLAVFGILDGSYGIFLPIGLGILGVHFFLLFLIAIFRLYLGKTGKVLKIGIPLIALGCLLIGLMLQI